MYQSLQTPIRYLKGIGSKRAKLFQNLGIEKIEDLLYYFPKRYEDRSTFLSISKVKIGEFQTIKGEVLGKRERRSYRRGFSIFELIVKDFTGKIFCIWFNQPYLKNYFKVGESVILYGRVTEFEGRLQMVSPEFEVLSERKPDPLGMGRITPIYSLTEGITQRYFRKTVKDCLDKFIPNIKDMLPYSIRSKYNLLNLAKSLLNIHFPESFELREQAYKRLSFEEFFIFQLLILLRKLKYKRRRGIIHNIEGELVENFIKNLNFSLTEAQKKVLEEIKRDMGSPFPMARLLQGDVGCGKTIIAFISSLIAIQTGYQVAFMVPTEILAFQHYLNFKKQIEDLGYQEKITICLLTGSLKKKKESYKEIREGRINFVLGTHTLIQENIKFKRLGLVVIDEQHKFGVAQRALLPKKGENPDVLIMTATPIPRTLAQTLYGDLDISVITELPPSRKPVKTIWFEETERDKVYKFIIDKVKEKRQVYIVYPVIEESKERDLKAAESMYKELKRGVFKEFNLSLLHGRIKSSEQERIMSLFSEGKIDILVATTVLEVGLDVPNASVMVVEHAERFGLSQLHQLRGRVGRGETESYFILISSPQTLQATKRLEAITKYSDGFSISEEDLKIRGPGEFFGKRQSGLSELKIADFTTQMDLLKIARREAINLLKVDFRLKLPCHAEIREIIKNRSPELFKEIAI